MAKRSVRINRRTLPWRTQALGLLLVQLLLVAAAPLADAHLEAEASDPVVHVESSGSDDCDPGHDHQLCLLCRALQLPAETGPDPADTPLAWPSLILPLPDRPVRATGQPLPGLGQPRAPPVG